MLSRSHMGDPHPLGDIYGGNPPVHNISINILTHDLAPFPIFLILGL
jgi:hypothetical protein